MCLLISGKNKIIFLFLLLLFVFTPVLGHPWETIIATGTAPLRDNMVRAQEEAIKNALINAVKETIKTVTPLTATFSYKDILEFIKSYSLLQEDKDEKNYFVQIEAEIDWKLLAKQLEKLGIIETGQGEKVLLFFILPEGIDFKTPLLSFWQRFFLLFNFTPVYKENLYREQILDYTFKKGIPFLLNFTLQIEPNENINGWNFNFTVELIHTVYHQTVYQGKMERPSFGSDIETLIRSVVEHTQNIAYNLAQGLSLWLVNYKKQEVTYFEIVFKNTLGYQNIFSVWDKMQKIGGIEVCLKEVSAKKVIYTGRYKGRIPELINELAGLGFAIEGVRDNIIYVSLE